MCIRDSNSWSSSLQRFDDCYSHPRNEIRIFSISFLCAPPSRLARNIQIRPQHLLAAASSGFKRPGGKNFCDEIRIPGTGECDWLRETGTSFGHMAVQNLVMKDRGNPQTCVFNQPPLRRVCKDSSFARSFLLTLSRDLPDPVFHYLRRFFRREVSAIGCEVCQSTFLRPIDPKTRQLRNLFFQRHAREKIGHAFFDRKARVLIVGDFFLRSSL